MIARSDKFESYLHMSLAAIAFCLMLLPGHRANLSLFWQPAAQVGRFVQPEARTALPVTDATGTSVPRGKYQRIVVLEGLDLVLNLAPESRVVGVDDWSVTHSIEGWRVVDRPRIGDKREIERILACNPDLVIACTMGEPDSCEAVAQLRAVHVAVFDLGYVITIDHLLERVQSLGAVLQAPARAARLQEQLRRRAELTSNPPPSAPGKKRALFICTAGEGFTVGGGADVFQTMLVRAGLRNVAAEAGIDAMPVVTQETPLRLDPQVLVVRERNHRSVGESMPLHQLNIEVTAEIPGPFLGVAVPMDLVDTAESLHDQVYCQHKKQ